MQARNRLVVLSNEQSHTYSKKAFCSISRQVESCVFRSPWEQMWFGKHTMLFWLEDIAVSLKQQQRSLHGSTGQS